MASEVRRPTDRWYRQAPACPRDGTMFAVTRLSWGRLRAGQSRNGSLATFQSAAEPTANDLHGMSPGPKSGHGIRLRREHHARRTGCYNDVNYRREDPAMQVSLSPDMIRFVKEQLAAGAYATPEDVLQAAVAALKQSESFGEFTPGELDALLAEGERGMERDGALTADEVFDEIRRQSADRRKDRS